MILLHIVFITELVNRVLQMYLLFYFLTQMLKLALVSLRKQGMKENIMYHFRMYLYIF